MHVEFDQDIQNFGFETFRNNVHNLLSAKYVFLSEALKCFASLFKNILFG